MLELRASRGMGASASGAPASVAGCASSSAEGATSALCSATASVAAWPARLPARRARRDAGGTRSAIRRRARRARGAWKGSASPPCTREKPAEPRPSASDPSTARPAAVSPIPSTASRAPTRSPARGGSAWGAAAACGHPGNHAGSVVSRRSASAPRGSTDATPSPARAPRPCEPVSRATTIPSRACRASPVGGPARSTAAGAVVSAPRSQEHPVRSTASPVPPQVDRHQP